MGYFHNPRIVRDGLVLYLDAANKRSYSGSGTEWKDLSGNNNGGVLTNGPIFDSQNFGNIVFDGVNDYILGLPTPNLNFGTSNFSACAWFKSNTSVRRTILSRFDYDNTGVIERGYYIDILSNGKIRTAFESNGSNFRVADSNTLVNTNSYFYVCLTRTNQTTINCYINGIFETTNTLIYGTPTNIDAITAPFSIARPGDYQTPMYTTYFVGNISNVQLYNKELSSIEIQNNYNALKGRFGL